ncbi:GlcNAc-PI de-N-acetylase [Nocardioides dokdonensis FR1436]|uniref:GlcNAc-PI de-N-acetylase n=1 Tax=Nocardioides dokdonensis FR1436 TaxID=1300347 RepID=A0A1A9GE42_9ACTN|nr:PIG-L deacetylase family protein [Nocardioides dokdonensis]ANH36547.1 GlcNAc-PI de-N-acetylase [Nocardioides dokdonensis FR1436]
MLELSIGAGPLTVVCLGAHPDDIEIGCGGTLLRLAQRGDVDVSALVLTGTAHRLEESRSAMARLFPGSRVHGGGLEDGRLPGSWEALKQALEDFAADQPAHRLPDIVLAPRVDDAHQDHRLVGGLASTVWRDALVLHYEIPKWDGDMASPSHFVALDEATARGKFEVLDECFSSQRSRDWWDEEMFLGLMRLRGMECRSRYAEGFVASKVLLDPVLRSRS